MYSDDVPIIYECLKKMGRRKRLDLILNTDGGFLTSARRIALLLREYADQLNILVPYRARSAGTLLCLSANELILGPLAELSPIDPIIRAGKKSVQDSPDDISSEDIRAFRTMAEEWFDLHSEENRMQVFALLSQRFFPTTLSSFFRADKYIRKIGVELLQNQLPKATVDQRAQIIDQLISNYTEHLHGFTRTEVQQLGLQARFASSQEEPLLHEIWRRCNQYMNEQRSDKNDLKTSLRAVLFSQNYSAHYIAGQASRKAGEEEFEKIPIRIKYGSGEWVVI